MNKTIKNNHIEQLGNYNLVFLTNLDKKILSPCDSHKITEFFIYGNNDKRLTIIINTINLTIITNNL